MADLYPALEKNRTYIPKAYSVESIYEIEKKLYTPSESYYSLWADKRCPGDYKDPVSYTDFRVHFRCYNCNEGRSGYISIDVNDNVSVESEKSVAVGVRCHECGVPIMRLFAGHLSLYAHTPFVPNMIDLDIYCIDLYTLSGSPFLLNYYEL